MAESERLLQEAARIPKVWRVKARSKLRGGFALSSADKGTVDKGELVAALDVRTIASTGT